MVFFGIAGLLIYFVGPLVALLGVVVVAAAGVVAVLVAIGLQVAVAVGSRRLIRSDSAGRQAAGRFVRVLGTAVAVCGFIVGAVLLTGAILVENSGVTTIGIPS
jgi:hypothetical protein